MRNLEHRPGKKIFDLLFWISAQNGESWEKYIILEKIAKLVLNQTVVGKWMANATTILLALGTNELAFSLGCDILSGNPSSIRDSLEAGKRLAHCIFIQFYSNTRVRHPKNRKRGYSESSPKWSYSKKEINDANSSLEYLTTSGTLKNQEGGGYCMNEEKIDTGELLMRIFTNSLEEFERLQHGTLKQLKEQKAQKLQEVNNLQPKKRKKSKKPKKEENLHEHEE
jgi:hypothetical protein